MLVAWDFFCGRSSIVERRLATIIDERLTEEPAIGLQGARSVGKSTLLRAVAAKAGSPVLDLDDLDQRAAAFNDPMLTAGEVFCLVSGYVQRCSPGSRIRCGWINVRTDRIMSAQCRVFFRCHEYARIFANRCAQASAKLARDQSGARPNSGQGRRRYGWTCRAGVLTDGHHGCEY